MKENTLGRERTQKDADKTPRLAGTKELEGRANVFVDSGSEGVGERSERGDSEEGMRGERRQ